MGFPEFSVAVVQPTLSSVQPRRHSLCDRVRRVAVEIPQGVMGVEVSHQETVVIGWESRGSEVVNPVVIIGVSFRRSVEVDDGEGALPENPHSTHLRSVVSPGDQGVGQCGDVQSRSHQDRNVTALRGPPTAARPLARRTMIGG